MRGRTWQQHVVEITAAMISGKLNATHSAVAYLAARAADIVDAIYFEKEKRNLLDAHREERWEEEDDGQPDDLQEHQDFAQDDDYGAAPASEALPYFGDDEPSE